MKVSTPGNPFGDDEKLLSLIKTGEPTVLEQTYKDFRSYFMKSLMSKFKCNEEEALDVYPEAFSIMYFNIKEEKLQAPLKAKLTTYITAVGKNLYLKKLNDKYVRHTERPEVLPERELDVEDDITHAYERKHKAEVVRNALDQIGDRCKELLELFFYRNFSVEAVMNTLSAPSEGAIRKRKHDCLKKLGNFIQRSGGGHGSRTIIFR